MDRPIQGPPLATRACVHAGAGRLLLRCAEPRRQQRVRQLAVSGSIVQDGAVPGLKLVQLGPEGGRACACACAWVGGEMDLGVDGCGYGWMWVWVWVGAYGCGWMRVGVVGVGVCMWVL